MDVRDAVESDAKRMAELTGSPTDVMRNLVHDRTVRIAERPEDETLGFVSFDAQRQTVYITQMEGTPDACERLLDEPLRFARGEGMSVELLVAEDNTDLKSVAADAGFTEHGAGPRFGDTRTVRYRLDP